MEAIGPDTGFILNVHPSNFVISGFTSTVDVRQLADLSVPVVADIGSGLLRPHPLLPDEPDANSMLAAGANLVTASADKLFGGPQAGLILGEPELVHTLRRPSRGPHDPGPSAGGPAPSSRSGCPRSTESVESVEFSQAARHGARNWS